MLSKTVYRQRGIHCKVPQTPVLGAIWRGISKKALFYERLCSESVGVKLICYNAELYLCL